MIDHVVQIARGEVGVREATGRNDGPRVEAYLGGASERGLSWCAAFVLWCYESAGYRWRDNRWLLRRVSTLYEVARRRSAILDGEPPLPGDLVIWLGRHAHASAGPSGHVAIVVGSRVSESGDGYEVEIVAGNESNAVVTRWMSVTDPRITAYLRPSRGLVAEPERES